MQRSMLYQPGNDTFADIRAMAASAGLQLWPSADASYRGLVAASSPQTHLGTVVVFHGNAGSAVHRDYYTKALGPLGYRVVLAEYPGYGGRPGELSEASFAADAAATLRRVRLDFGSPVFAWGESLGAAVLAAAVARGEIPDGLVLLTPWDTLLNLAQRHFPWLPVRLFLRDRYDTVANLANYTGRKAVVVAQHDEVVPTALGYSLHNALPVEKALWVMAGVGHNNWRTDPGNPLWREVMDYLRSGWKSV